MTKRIAIIVVILTATVLFVNGQSTPPPNPTPTPLPGRSETGPEAVRRLDRAHDRIAQQAYSNLYGQAAYAKSPRYSPKYRAAMVALYRKPRKTEIKILEPAKRHQEKYAELLKDKNSGLFKLVPDQGCEEKEKVVSAKPNCLKYDFPGAGTSYSFRLGNYRIRRLADITLVKKSLVARGVLSGAIFVVLGNVPIENVGLNTPGLSYLSEYRPVKSAKDAMEEAKRFARGVKKNGFIYGRGVYVSKNNTFAMRSIAYRGKFVRSEAGVTYNELNFDKRRDVIIVFRIVEVGNDGSPTIVWKRLRESKSPKVKIYRGNE